MAFGELLGLLGRWMLRASLKLCCVPEETVDSIERRHMPRDSSGAHLICYLDGVSDELVRRQLEFRKSRKIERSASRTSLSSLDIVTEGHLLHSGGLLRRNMSSPAMGSMLSSSPAVHHLVESQARRERCG